MIIVFPKESPFSMRRPLSGDEHHASGQTEVTRISNRIRGYSHGSTRRSNEGWARNRGILPAGAALQYGGPTGSGKTGRTKLTELAEQRF
jgi:hypothetical protein